MIGIDVIEIDRIKNADRVLQKIALQNEIDYIKRESSAQMQRQKVAALFAVKEAVMKALELGQGSGVVFKDIKLCHLPSGKPYVEVYGAAKAALENLGNKKLEISLSHSKKTAVAVAIVV